MSGPTPRPGPHLFGRPAVPSPSSASPSDPTADTVHAAIDEPAPNQEAANHRADGQQPDEQQPDERPAGDAAVPTGEARVDEALATLDGLAGRPVSEQVAGYEEIHRALQDTLATVDEA